MTLDHVTNHLEEGTVLRASTHSSDKKTYWEAVVDDGSSDHVRAFRGRGFCNATFDPGQRVRVTVSRHLSTLRSVEPLPDQPSNPASALASARSSVPAPSSVESTPELGSPEEQL